MQPETLLIDFISGMERDERELFSVYEPESGAALPTSGKEFAALCRRWRTLAETLPDAVIPIFGRMTPDMLAAYFGVMLAGKLPVFISHPNAKISPEDYRLKLENYRRQFGSSVFIGERSDQLAGVRVLTPEALSTNGGGGVDGNGNGRKPDAPRLQADAPLFLQCSSGSTGLQKAVAITPRMLAAQLDSYAGVLKLSGDDVIVSWLPLYHDMGLIATFFLPLLKGVPVVYIDPFDWVANPGLLPEQIERRRGTLTWLPNFAFQFLCKTPARYDLSSMRAFINCSEPVTRAAFDMFAAHHRAPAAKLAACYALAENVFAVSQTDIGNEPVYLRLDNAAYQRHRVIITAEGEKFAVSCGRIIPGAQVRIESAPGEDVGEILIGGDCAVTGYYQRETEAEQGWLRTGDLGFVREGQLYVTGRRKDIIINQGKNIYPQDVEEAANRRNEVYKGRVVCLGDANPGAGSEDVLLLFEPARTLTIAEREAVCRDLKRSVDGQFDVSSRVVCAPHMWLRKTSSGKIARAANLEKYHRCRDQHIWVVGDSHVRLLWTADRSHTDTLENVHARWVGVLWADELHKFDDKISAILAKMKPNDALAIEAGEPECRVVIPGAPDPAARIRESVAKYEEFFIWLRQRFAGALGYITGVPTDGKSVGPERPNPAKPIEDTWLPVIGTPEKRYHFQRLFYDEMRRMCHRLNISFIDACTPFIGESGFIENRFINPRDGFHLKPEFKARYFDWLDQTFGFVSSKPFVKESGNGKFSWDGSYEDYLRIMKREIRRLSRHSGEIDLDHLISSGAVDSLSVIEITLLLETRFGVEIDLSGIRRGDYESVNAMYHKFVAGRNPALRKERIEALSRVGAV